MKTPPQYRSPLRSRKEIIDFLINTTEQRIYDYKPHPFCFNVKVRRLDFDFDHLLKIFQQMEDDPIYTHEPDWLEAAKQRYEDTNINDFCDSVMDDARQRFLDQDHVLYDGTSIKATFSFEGRSGGWLSINSFEGHDFTANYEYGSRVSLESLRELLTGLPYPVLRRLYKFVVILKVEVNNREEELEFQGAYSFFGNVCADIPQPDAVQKRLPFAQTPA
jgi:hypothetical protein